VIHLWDKWRAERIAAKVARKSKEFHDWQDLMAWMRLNGSYCPRCLCWHQWGACRP
jgi:hypothetical protein